MSLLEYQKPHVEQLANAYKNSNTVLDASDTGTGKTYSAIALALTLGLKPFIVCPKSVISSWLRVVNAFGCDHYGISNYESLRCNAWYPPSQVLIKKKGCPYFAKGYNWSLPADTLLIFDEAHKCKNPVTQNANMLITASKSGAKILILSATIADKPSYFAVYAVAMGLCTDVQLFNIYLRKLQTVTGMSPMLTLHRRVFPHHGSRMKIAELGDQFPSNLVIADTYFMGKDVSTEIQKQYNNIKAAKAVRGSQEEVLIQYVADEAEMREQSASCRLVEIIRARQKIEALKVPTIKELATDHLASGLSVAIFVNYLDTLRLLGAELNCKCYIHGGQSLSDRDNMIELFQTNKERLIIATIQSGGVGISLHDTNGNYPRVSIISPSWSGQDLIQALGRIHRAAGKSPCIQKLVYCQGTVEEFICGLVQTKLNNYSQLNDNENESDISLGNPL